MNRKRCKECPPGTRRKAPYPGPRCWSHHCLVKTAQKAAAHGKRIERTYGITAAEYDRLLAAQGGVCAICRRATGARRRLAVDHDHKTGEVRGLLCSVDNKMLGHLRDDPEAFERVAEYLRNPPFKIMKS